MFCGAVALAMFCTASLALPNDAKGSKDHPLISRFDGSTLSDYSVVDYDEAFLPNQLVSDAKNAKGLTLEGKISRYSYILPVGKSALEAYRNYMDALKRGGFAILFECSGVDKCGKDMSKLVIGSGKMISTNNYWFNDANRAILAKASAASGDAYVFIYIMPNRDLPTQPIIFQEVVEMKSMAKDQVSTKDAGAIQQSLSSDGKVALYGIYFDTDKAEIKPESKAQLDEMARMLNANAAMKVFVVGHTDSQGAFAHNMELSQKRADAIVSALTATYHIAPNRLIAKGVASLSPLAPNTDDTGRAKKRRVELLVQ